jgi:hypothetical protein
MNEKHTAQDIPSSKLLPHMLSNEESNLFRQQAETAEDHQAERAAKKEAREHKNRVTRLIMVGTAAATLMVGATVNLLRQGPSGNTQRPNVEHADGPTYWNSGNDQNGNLIMWDNHGHTETLPR